MLGLYVMQLNPFIIVVVRTGTCVQADKYICTYIVPLGRFEVVIIAPALVLQLKCSAAIKFGSRFAYAP